MIKMKSRKKFLQEAGVFLIFLILLFSNFLIIAYAKQDILSQIAQSNTPIYRSSLMSSAGYTIILEEDFSDGIMPTTNWKLTQTNPNETWYIDSSFPHSEPNCATVHRGNEEEGEVHERAIGELVGAAKLELARDLRVQVHVADERKLLARNRADLRIDIEVGGPLRESTIVVEELAAIGDRVRDRESGTQPALDMTAEEGEGVRLEVFTHGGSDRRPAGIGHRLLDLGPGVPVVESEPHIPDQSPVLELGLRIGRTHLRMDIVEIMDSTEPIRIVDPREEDVDELETQMDKLGNKGDYELWKMEDAGGGWYTLTNKGSSIDRGYPCAVIGDIDEVTTLPSLSIIPPLP